jgi:ABC-type multidrug transport system permease subunit
MDSPQRSSPRFSYHPLWQLVLARLREFVRQPEAVFWSYVFPLLMMVVLGIAFRSRPAQTFRVDIVQGPMAPPVQEVLSADNQFVLKMVDEASARARLKTGKTDVVIRAEAASATAYHYFFDPGQPTSQLARQLAEDALQRAAGRENPVETVDHEMVETGSRYIDFLVPGLIGLGLMGGGLWGVGFGIVDLRIRKLLKRYLATPMRRSDFLLAMMVSRLIFTVIECALVLVAGRVLFGVENQGSYIAIAILVVLGAFEFSGIGLLVASRVQTLEAVSGLMNLVMLPMWVASGVFYSIERFPESVQPLLQLLPLTPLIDGLRKVMLEGTSLAGLGPQVAICLAWGAGTFLLALRWFRWS